MESLLYLRLSPPGIDRLEELRVRVLEREFRFSGAIPATKICDIMYVQKGLNSKI